MAGETTADAVDVAEAAASIADDAAEVETGEDAATACMHSFSAHTWMLMADGSGKPISKVKVGKKSGLPTQAPGEVQYKSSERRWITTTMTCSTSLSLRHPVKSQTLHTTAGHRIWDLTRHTWEKAAALPIGDHLQPAGQQTAVVTAVITISGEADMYDPTITRTFYAGATAIRVHNIFLRMPVE